MLAHHLAAALREEGRSRDHGGFRVPGMDRESATRNAGADAPGRWEQKYRGRLSPGRQTAHEEGSAIRPATQDPVRLAAGFHPGILGACPQMRPATPLANARSRCSTRDAGLRPQHKQ